MSLHFSMLFVVGVKKGIYCSVEQCNTIAILCSTIRSLPIIKRSTHFSFVYYAL